MRTRNREDHLTTVMGLVKRNRTDISSELSGTTVIDFWNVKTMTDQKTPGYFRAVREGGVIPVSPMNRSSTVWLPEMGSARGEATARPGGGFSLTLGYKYQADGIFGTATQWKQARDLVVADPGRPASKEDVLQAALASAQTDAWDTATFLAEFGKTVEMMTSFKDRYIDHVNRVRAEAERRWRKRRNVALRLVDVFASVWLEMRYGLRPLMYDMQDMAESYRRLTEGVETPLARGWVTRSGDPSTKVATTSVAAWTILGNPTGQTSWKNPGVNPGQSTISASEFDTWYTMTKVRERKVRATVGVAVTTRAITQFDPAITAWEVIPFSFIADWFINLGEAIAAFSPFATGLFKYATFVESDATTIRLDAYAQLKQTGSLVCKTTLPGISSLSCTTESYVRTVESNIAPTLNVRINLDAAKVLDLAALVASFKMGVIKSLINRR